MNGYIAMWNGKKADIYAETQLEAKKKAVTVLRVPLTRMGLLSITLAELNVPMVDGKPVGSGDQVTISTSSI